MNEKKGRKRSKKIFAGALAAVLVVVVVFGYSILNGSGGSATEAAAGSTKTIASAVTETGSIVETVTGSGNLAYADSAEIKVLSGIKVSQVNVESGDNVVEGDVLAVLDSNSIASNIASTQSSINSIDGELKALDEDASDTIDANVSGRVKKIYADVDGKVSSVIREHGALILMSVDGLLAVDIESSAGLVAGGLVDVELSDASIVDGTVERVVGNIYTVTFNDNGPNVSETVKIKAEDGTELGSGEAYIHQAVSITGTDGTIKSIDVDENEEVDAGEALITLTEEVRSTEYQNRLAQRAEFVTDLKNLLALAEDPTIKAPYSGMIENVNLAEGVATGTAISMGTSGTDSIASAPSDFGAADSKDDALKGNLVDAVMMAAGNPNTSVSIKTAEVGISEPRMLLTTANATEDPANESEEMDTRSLIEDLSDLNIAYPVTGEQVVTSIQTTAFSGTVSWNPNPDSNTFQPDTQYTAKITLTAKEGTKFSKKKITVETITNIIRDATIANLSIKEMERTLTFNAAFSVTASKTEQANGTNSASEANAANSYPVPSGSSEMTGGSTGNPSSAYTGSASANSTYTGSASANSAYSGAASTGNSYTASSSTSSIPSSSTFSLAQAGSKIAAFTIMSDDFMQIEVSVDELDVLSIREGQEAEVTFDALEGIFIGTVTNIDHTATTSGGVVNYMAAISIPKEGQMLAGLSVHVTIIIAEANDILVIPADALQEVGDRIFVYTEKDEDQNILGGEVDVTTGLSDENLVEITRGLESGDIIYYYDLSASVLSRTNGTTTTGGMFGSMDFGDREGFMQDNNGRGQSGAEGGNGVNGNE